VAAFWKGLSETEAVEANMTCGELRAKLISLLKLRPEISGELLSDQGDLHELETQGGNHRAEINRLRAEITRLQTALSRTEAEILDAGNQFEAQCIVKQPQQILELEFENPVPPADFSATTIAGGVFPSSGAKQEWKQVLEPHEEDFEDSNLVGASGWVLNPEFSDIISAGSGKSVRRGGGHRGSHTGARTSN
jgi:chromosome segregation ATPase